MLVVWPTVVGTISWSVAIDAGAATTCIKARVTTKIPSRRMADAREVASTPARIEASAPPLSDGIGGAAGDSEQIKLESERHPPLARLSGALQVRDTSTSGGNSRGPR